MDRESHPAESPGGQDDGDSGLLSRQRARARGQADRVWRRERRWTAVGPESDRVVAERIVRVLVAGADRDAIESAKPEQTPCAGPVDGLSVAAAGKGGLPAIL